MDHSNHVTQRHVVSGYAVCGLYPSIHPGQTVFDPRLTHWISTFYAVAVVQSTLTTGCMAYKIWKTDRQSAAFRAQESHLLPVVRILVESAALQLFVEILLVSLYAADYNAQYILLEIVTPLVVRTLLFSLFVWYLKIPFFVGNHIHCYYHPNCAPYFT